MVGDQHEPDAAIRQLGADGLSRPGTWTAHQPGGPVWQTRHDVRIAVVQDPRRGYFSALLILAILVIAFWKYILVIGLAALLITLTWREHKRSRAEIEGLRRRADQQHNWVYADDPRGTYGHGYGGDDA